MWPSGKLRRGEVLGRQKCLTHNFTELRILDYQIPSWAGHPSLARDRGFILILS